MTFLLLSLEIRKTKDRIQKSKMGKRKNYIKNKNYVLSVD